MSASYMPLIQMVSMASSLVGLAADIAAAIVCHRYRWVSSRMDWLTAVFAGMAGYVLLFVLSGLMAGLFPAVSLVLLVFGTLLRIGLVVALAGVLSDVAGRLRGSEKVDPLPEIR